MMGFFSWLVALLLLIVLGIVLIGAAFFCLGTLVEMLRKFQQFTQYRRTKMAAQEIVDMIGRAKDGFSAAIDAMTGQVEAATVNAMTETQAATAKAQLQEMIDSAKRITDAAQAMIAPATPPTPAVPTAPATS